MKLFNNEFRLKFLAHKKALNKINELLDIKEIEPHLREKMEVLRTEFQQYELMKKIPSTLEKVEGKILSKEEISEILNSITYGKWIDHKYNLPFINAKWLEENFGIEVQSKDMVSYTYFLENDFNEYKVVEAVCIPGYVYFTFDFQEKYYKSDELIENNSVEDYLIHQF